MGRSPTYLTVYKRLGGGGLDMLAVAIAEQLDHVIMGLIDALQTASWTTIVRKP